MSQHWPVPIINPNTLRDATYNCAAEFRQDTAYAKGVLVGAVCGLMAVGWHGPEAIAAVLAHLPQGFVLETVPQPWRHAIPADIHPFKEQP